ncbi:MAG TPA: hypothetical protein VFR87_06150, partial [Nocardioidaceae bacterium]|nr:hypothetical protein [Nocardioidaceae bacterium]
TEYVEVRMVFGAESDERFDWTKIETLEPETDPVLTEPVMPENVAGCKNGGWETAGYSNQGRCVSEVRKHNNTERQAAKKAALAEKKAAKAAAKGAKGAKATKVKGKKK